MTCGSGPSSRFVPLSAHADPYTLVSTRPVPRATASVNARRSRRRRCRRARCHAITDAITTQDFDNTASSARLHLLAMVRCKQVRQCRIRACDGFRCPRAPVVRAVQLHDQTNAHTNTSTPHTLNRHNRPQRDGMSSSRDRQRELPPLSHALAQNNSIQTKPKPGLPLGHGEASKTRVVCEVTAITMTLSSGNEPVLRRRCLSCRAS